MKQIICNGVSWNKGTEDAWTFDMYISLQNRSKAGKSCIFCNSIIKNTSHKLDHREIDGGVGHDYFTQNVLMNYLEKAELVAYSVAQACGEIWPDSLAVGLELELEYSTHLWILKMVVVIYCPATTISFRLFLSP